MRPRPRTCLVEFRGLERMAIPLRPLFVDEEQNDPASRMPPLGFRGMGPARRERNEHRVQDPGFAHLVSLPSSWPSSRNDPASGCPHYASRAWGPMRRDVEEGLPSGRRLAAAISDRILRPDSDHSDRLAPSTRRIGSPSGPILSARRRGRTAPRRSALRGGAGVSHRAARRRPRRSRRCRRLPGKVASFLQSKTPRGSRKG